MKNFIRKFYSKDESKSVGLVFNHDDRVNLFLGSVVNIDCTGLWIDIDNIKKYVNHLDYVNLAHWKCCFLSCKYCSGKKIDEFDGANHYDIMPVIEQLIDAKLITKKTKIVFDCGDATLHPEFDKLMFFLLNFGMQDIVINTSAMRFCNSISEGIVKYVAKIVVSLDSGCPYIYERVKGINKHDIAIENIKRYLQYEESDKKQIIVKYTLVQGINDNKKEILDWFMFTRNLGVKKLAFDIDKNWFNSLEHNYPDYLKELVVFVKELASFNNYEIDFSSEINEVDNVCL